MGLLIPCQATATTPNTSAFTSPHPCHCCHSIDPCLQETRGREVFLQPLLQKGKARQGKMKKGKNRKGERSEKKGNEKRPKLWNNSFSGFTPSSCGCPCFSAQHFITQRIFHWAIAFSVSTVGLSKVYDIVEGGKAQESDCPGFSFQDLAQCLTQIPFLKKVLLDLLRSSISLTPPAALPTLLGCRVFFYHCGVPGIFHWESTFLTCVWLWGNQISTDRQSREWLYAYTGTYTCTHTVCTW